MGYQRNITRLRPLSSGHLFSARVADPNGFVPFAGGDPHFASRLAEPKDQDRPGTALLEDCGFNTYRGLGP
jgi:hypothetical protein